MSTTTFTPPTVKTLRVDIGGNPDFTKKGYGRRLVAMGGRFSECRGQSYERYLTVPTTAAGLDLAAEAIEAFGGRSLTSRRNDPRATVVVEPSGLHSGDGMVPNTETVQTVQYVHISVEAKAKVSVRAQLDAILAAYVSACQVWWDTKGRAAYELKLRQEEERRQAARRAMPRQLMTMIDAMHDCGYSAEEIRAHVSAALDGVTS
jgi:hypothetical protein